jgi:glycosyltransferase involved in cell wall biosynthesis
MTQPLISIIIPVKNSVQTIKACLESVFNQTFSSLEVLILDAVSTDGTLEEIKNFSKSEDRLRIYSEKDKGTYDAMNKGVQLAKGKWLFFLGSDDQLFDQLVLEKISKVMSHTKAKVVYGNVLIVGDTAMEKFMQENSPRPNY